MPGSPILYLNDVPTFWLLLYGVQGLGLRKKPFRIGFGADSEIARCTQTISKIQSSTLQNLACGFSCLECLRFEAHR